jgi:DNA polymerase elongation subunit (family B)
MKHTALAQTDKQHDTKRRRLDCDWERGGYSEYDAHDEPDDIDQENWYLDAEDAMQDADTDQHIEDAEQEDTGQEDAQTDAGARERDFCEEGTVYSTTGSTKAHHCVCVLKDSWLRPAVPEDAEILTASAPLLFQQMEADYYLGEEKPGFQRGQTAVLRFHGATAEGYSVLCHVRGVQPYLYIEMPEQMQERDLGWFADVLAREMELRQVPRRRDTAYIRELRVEVLTDLFGYQFDKKKRFIRICTGVPGFIGPLRQLLETGVRLPQLGTSRKFPTYESNIMFVLRAMIDKNIVGSNWLELPAHKYHVLQPGEKTAHSQIEVEISHEHLISHSPDEGAEWSRMAPLRILSFDIECAGRQGHFPEAQHDSVIQIANCVTVQGQPEPIIKNVFTLGTCSSIVGADVHQFWREDTVRKNEIRMLEQWRDFVVAVDPDILTGYNIINFDLPYLLDRARALGIDVFPYLGRIIEHPSAMKDSTFSSKAYGTRESKDINIDGRVQLDVLPAIQRDYKLTSYTLNNVSAHFLKEQKEDVHHSLITVLYNGDGSSADTRRRLAAYCLKDACLPQRLLDKLLIVVNYIEMARVTGIPITWVLTRGQQIRVLSQLLRRCKAEGILVPTPESSSKKNSSNNYEGATVIAPKAGYYDEPIATLDFASLYPSIMIAHNLCYSTLLPKSIILGTDGDVLRTKHGDFAADEHIKTPSGDFFVTRKRHEGVLPRILVYLLAARDAAKKLMKAASSDPFLYAVYNGRQLAIKVVANSVYGFTGAVAGHLPCIPISASVTAFGRDMIMAAAKTVKEEFTIQNGYEHDADVIYGGKNTHAQLTTRHGLGHGALRHQGSGPGACPGKERRRHCVQEVHRPDQTRVRKGILPLPAHHQETLRRTLVGKHRQTHKTRRQGHPDGTPRQLAARTQRAQHGPASHADRPRPAQGRGVRPHPRQRCVCRPRRHLHVHHQQVAGQKTRRIRRQTGTRRAGRAHAQTRPCNCTPHRRPRALRHRQGTEGRKDIRQERRPALCPREQHPNRRRILHQQTAAQPRHRHLQVRRRKPRESLSRRTHTRQTHRNPKKHGHHALCKGTAAVSPLQTPRPRRHRRPLHRMQTARARNIPAAAQQTLPLRTHLLAHVGTLPAMPGQRAPPRHMRKQRLSHILHPKEGSERTQGKPGPARPLHTRRPALVTTIQLNTSLSQHTPLQTHTTSTCIKHTRLPGTYLAHLPLACCLPAYCLSCLNTCVLPVVSKYLRVACRV